MDIHVSGRHFDMTGALKKHAENKIQKLDKFHLKIESAQVILEVEKFRHICEIILSGKNLKMAAKEKSVDMYAAFDKCYDKITGTLSRQHDRLKDHKSRKLVAAKKSMRGE